MQKYRRHKMYFDELIEILYDNELIGSDLWEKLQNWNRKENFFFTNIKERRRNRVDQTCKIERINFWLDLYNFSLEIKYDIYPKKPPEYEKFSISIPRYLLITGQLRWNKIYNIRIDEYYGTMSIIDRMDEIDKMTDIEHYWMEQAYRNWYNPEEEG
jgi:hypothetical protein